MVNGPGCTQFKTGVRAFGCAAPLPEVRRDRAAGRRRRQGSRLGPVDARAAPASCPSRRPTARRPIGKISAQCCSFSSVSAPIFASKYAFYSIFQNLPDYLATHFEIWQNFANFATFAKFLLEFHENCCFFQTDFFANILRLQRCKRMQIL